MAWRNLMARKLRTALTLLGVVIGSTAIIVMMSLGLGTQAALEQMILNMGDVTHLSVMPGMDEMGRETKLNDASIKNLRKLDHVQAVTPMEHLKVTLRSGRLQAEWTTLVGVDAAAFKEFGWEMEEGQFLREGAPQYVFGSQVAYNFYNPKMPVFPTYDEDGNEIISPPPIKPMASKISLEETDDMPFMDPYYGEEAPKKEPKSIDKIDVVGVLEKRNDYMADSSVYTSLGNLAKVKKALGLPADSRSHYQEVKLVVDDHKNVEEVQRLLRLEGYDSYGLTNLLEEMKSGMLVFQAIFGGIGAISFLVAAIGIANTMIMSIYERTREIGVMKVIGASIKDIKRLFLVEAGFIGLLGGALGILFSAAISFIINSLAGEFLTMAMDGGGLGSETAKISIIPFWLVVVALVFSSLIGVLAGYFPARRAMNLSALDAIRTE